MLIINLLMMKIYADYPIIVKNEFDNGMSCWISKLWNDGPKADASWYPVPYGGKECWRRYVNGEHYVYCSISYAAVGGGPGSIRGIPISFNENVLIDKKPDEGGYLVTIVNEFKEVEGEMLPTIVLKLEVINYDCNETPCNENEKYENCAGKACDEIFFADDTKACQGIVFGYGDSSNANGENKFDACKRLCSNDVCWTNCLLIPCNDDQKYENCANNACDEIFFSDDTKACQGIVYGYGDHSNYDGENKFDVCKRSCSNNDCWTKCQRYKN